MHRCLEVEDVVVLIIRHLSNDIASSQGRSGYHGGTTHSNIAALAATCRALYIHAVNALWEEMTVSNFLQAVSRNLGPHFTLFTSLRR